MDTLQLNFVPIREELLRSALNFLWDENPANLLAKRTRSMAFGFAFILNKTEAVKSTATEKETKQALIVIWFCSRNGVQAV